VLDSAAKPGSGLLQGNLLWMGDFKECISITASVNSTGPAPKLMNPFKGQYCKVGIQIAPAQAPATDIAVSWII